MKETESVDTVPKIRKKARKQTPYRDVCIKVYVSKEEFESMAQEATKAGYRSSAHKCWLNPPNKFEPVPNTKGLGKFLRVACFPSWVKGEAERLIKIRELEEQAKKLGKRLT